MAISLFILLLHTGHFHRRDTLVAQVGPRPVAEITLKRDHYPGILQG